MVVEDFFYVIFVMFDDGVKLLFWDWDVVMVVMIGIIVGFGIGYLIFGVVLGFGLVIIYLKFFKVGIY